MTHDEGLDGIRVVFATLSSCFAKQRRRFSLPASMPGQRSEGPAAEWKLS